MLAHRHRQSFHVTEDSPYSLWKCEHDDHYHLTNPQQEGDTKRRRNSAEEWTRGKGWSSWKPQSCVCPVLYVTTILKGLSHEILTVIFGLNGFIYAEWELLLVFKL
jgi:hypothetical protein